MHEALGCAECILGFRRAEGALTVINPYGANDVLDYTTKILETGKINCESRTRSLFHLVVSSFSDRRMRLFDFPIAGTVPVMVVDNPAGL